MSYLNYFQYGAFREGQKELAEAVYRAVGEGEDLVVETRSGFGKTAAVLSGALAAAYEQALRIIYLCRTRREVDRVVEEVRLIQEKNPVRALPLTSKYEMCLHRKDLQKPVSLEVFHSFCNFEVKNDLCPYFLRLHKLIPSLHSYLDNTVLHTPKAIDIIENSRLHGICPYEYLRLGLPSSRLVIGTFGYIFSDTARSTLTRSFIEDSCNCVLIFDEAHNLYDAMIEAYSLTLKIQDLRFAILEARFFQNPVLESNLRLLESVLNRAIYGMPQRVDSVDSFLQRLKVDRLWLTELAYTLSSLATGSLALNFFAGQSPPLSLLRLGSFLISFTNRVSEDNYLVITSSEDRQGYIKLLNIDPATDFREVTSKFKVRIFLSATIGSREFFCRSLGMKIEEASWFDWNSRARTEKVLVILDTDATTEFKKRSQQLFAHMADKIAHVCNAIQGGIGVFTSSYETLKWLVNALNATPIHKPVFVEKRNMSYEESSKLAEAYKSSTKREGAVLVGVQGGRFSEGEDFAEGQMNAVIIVGFALPPPSPILFAQLAHFRRHHQQGGYMLACLLPALRKAVQAAGRPLRSPDRKFLVILMDRRFARGSVYGNLPTWMKAAVKIANYDASTLERDVSSFFTS